FGIKGLFAFLITTQILGVILFTLTQVTRSNLDKTLVNWIVGGFAQLHDWAGPAAFKLIVVAGILGILALAYRVSVRVFEKREL
ncbi:MAG: hypothetical protein ACWGSQ_00210, partial [Longimicrobiales bacterium]